LRRLKLGGSSQYASEAERMQYDDIIGGAGSTGADVASRLSEDANRSVLLLVAGPDYPAVDQTPSDLLDTTISVGPHD